VHLIDLPGLILCSIRILLQANHAEVKQGANPYYTNSSQLPVNHTDDIFEVLQLQDDLQTKYTGGTVLHIFTGEANMPAISAKNLIRKITNNFHLPYITISPTFSICPSHGYIGGEHFKCPNCGKDTEVYSRIVGYMRPVNQWNDGKKEEFKDRQLFVSSKFDKEPELSTLIHKEKVEV
jgi:anaerobic ribonucleoside-triphosphate reductase